MSSAGGTGKRRVTRTQHLYDEVDWEQTATKRAPGQISCLLLLGSKAPAFLFREHNVNSNLGLNRILTLSALHVLLTMLHEEYVINYNNLMSFCHGLFATTTSFPNVRQIDASPPVVFADSPMPASCFDTGCNSTRARFSCSRNKNEQTTKSLICSARRESTSRAGVGSDSRREQDP